MPPEHKVSSELNSAIEKELSKISQNFGGSAPETAVFDCKTSLFSYLTELLEINQQINLTAIRDYEEGVRAHIFDSIQLAHISGLGAVLDWGSGGGFPGVPLFLCRAYFQKEKARNIVAVLDSKKKKVSAAQEVFARIGFSSPPEFIWGRGEEVIKSRSFDSIVMRAVVPVGKTIPWLDHRVKSWYIFASSEQRAEWGSVSKRLENKGFSLSGEHTYALPGHHSKRFIVKLTSQNP